MKWKWKSKGISLIAVCLTLIACQGYSGDPAGQALLPDIPDSWSAEKVDPSPLPSEPGSTIEFDRRVLALILESLEHNRDLRSAQASLELAIASRNTDRADLFPDLSFGLSSRETETIDGDGSRQFNTSYSSEFSSSWELDIWGRLRNSASAANASLLAEKWSLEAFHQSLVANVLLVWLDGVEAKQRMELTQKNFDIQSQRLVQFERRLDLGLVDALDVRLSRNNLANTEAELYERRLDYRQQLRSLEVLLGRYPKAEISSPDLLPELSPIRALASPLTMLERRPDILEAKAELEAAGLLVAEARKSMYPSLTLSASYANDDEDFSRLFDFDEWLSQFTASLLQPIFQGGRLKARLDQRQSELAILLSEYELTVLEAWEEVENYLFRERLTKKRLYSLQSALTEARSAESLTLAQYEQGLASSFEYLSAQNRTINAEDTLISARVEYVANRIRLHLALGMPIVEL